MALEQIDLRSTDRVLVLDPEEFGWLQGVVARESRDEHLGPRRRVLRKLDEVR